MNQITADPVLRSRLNGLDEHLEIRDEQGKTIGHFLPLAVYEELFYGALAAESGHSKEELKSRHHETGGRSLKEIWKSLGQE